MNNNLLLCPLCQIEIIDITGITIKEKIEIHYICQKKSRSIFWDDYYKMINEYSNSSEIKNCDFSKHLYLNAKKYCFVCNKWICEKCLPEHDSLFCNHLFCLTKIDVSMYCSSHGNNMASFYCVDCKTYFCDKCKKRHKQHKRYSMMEYKKKLSSDLPFTRIDILKSFFNKFLVEEHKIYKESLESSTNNGDYQQEYKSYYLKRKILNKQLYDLYELVLWNYGTLSMKAWRIYDILKIINTIQFNHILNFSEFSQNIIHHDTKFSNLFLMIKNFQILF